MSSHSKFVDIAVVGGGVSGIYTGWRLATAKPAAGPLRDWLAKSDGKLNIEVFEMSKRIGGRLLSAQSAHAPETVCEVGGMRYVSAQTLVRGLVENELKLPRHQQVVDQDNNLAYLRGKQLRVGETSNASLLPYKISWAESQYLTPVPPAKPNDPDGLIGWGIAKILPGVATLTGAALHKYLREATVDGIPLYKHGFWNLLARTLTSEGLSLAKTMVGYDSLGCNANAVDLITEYFDFTPDVQYYLLDGGYDAVPWELERRFKNAGGTVSQGARLVEFEAAKLPDGTEGVNLHFAEGPKVTARAIVLAMPRRSIQLLAQRGPVLDPQHAHAKKVTSLLNAVEPIPLFKLFLVYPHQWWTAVGVSQGRSLTDLPVHQCYYWPNGPKGTMTSGGPGIIMAYNDQTGVEFWGGLHYWDQFHVRKNGVSSVPVDHHLTRLRENWTHHQAPQEMVSEMHRQLVEMHNVEYAPEPIDSAYMDWSSDPYGGGVHFWNIGARSWEVLNQMTKPVADFPCYVCGEAWSTNQTWVEGALQTAEIVLQKHFHLSAPEWISDSSTAASGGA